MRFGVGQLQKYTLINYEKFSLQYGGAIIWNSLPNVLKEIKSSKAFKKHCIHMYNQLIILFDTLINGLCNATEVILGIMPLFFSTKCKKIIGEPLKSSSELAVFPFALTIYIFLVTTRLCTMYEGWQ